jgi:hypothetical protein
MSCSSLPTAKQEAAWQPTQQSSGVPMQPTLTPWGSLEETVASGTHRAANPAKKLPPT